MRTPFKGDDGMIADLLAKLNQQSCEERYAEVTAGLLAKKAAEMNAAGYVHNAETLEALRLYLAGYGLALFGGYGAGKTYFFQCLKPITRPRDLDDYERPQIHIVHLAKFLTGRTLDEVREDVLRLRNREIVLDDIGTESVFNDYGNRFEAFPWLLEMRLESPFRTHMTTNLSAEALERRYGGRSVDRIHEMCADVTLTGKSHRRTKPNASVVYTLERARAERAARSAEADLPK